MKDEENQELSEGADLTKKGRPWDKRPAHGQAPAHVDTQPIIFKQQESLTERLEMILDAMGFNERKKIKNFILKYWTDTPTVQNPYALFDLLTKMVDFGGVVNANIVVSYVFGGPNQYGLPWAPPWAQQQQQGHDREDEVLRDWTEKMMTEKRLGIRMRNMAAVMAVDTKEETKDKKDEEFQLFIGFLLSHLAPAVKSALETADRQTVAMERIAGALERMAKLDTSVEQLKQLIEVGKTAVEEAAKPVEKSDREKVP